MFSKRISLWWVAMLAIGAETSFNVFFQLQKAERSGYYSVVVKSMSRNAHNFWLGAADPAGVISLDKIPGAYWLPALLVKVFGFHNWTVIAPNGFATLTAVLVFALLSRELLGSRWSIVATILFANTPILIAVARSNEPESFFVLWLTVAAYAAMRAIRASSFFWLMGAALAIAGAFQCYMIVAWAFWPALAVGWLANGANSVKRYLQLVIAGLTSLFFSVLWIVAVELTPVNSRPYIGSTLHNNAWEMVFGYNALGRFGNSGSMVGVDKTSIATFKSFTPPFAGHPSLFRLFYHQVIGQAGWLLPTALVALGYLLWQQIQLKNVLLLGTWLVVDVVMFSAVSGMHQFYITTMALPIILLVCLALQNAYRRRNLPVQLLLGLSSLATTWVVEALNGWYLPVVFVLTVGAYVLWLLFQLLNRRKLAVWALIIAMAAMPTAWSIDAMQHPSFVNAMAGPPDSYTAKLGSNSHNSTLDNDADDTKHQSHYLIINYLKQHQGKAKFMLATFAVDAAAAYVLQTNSLVLPIGGFNGADPAPTLEQFKKMVAAGQVRFVLMNRFSAEKLNLGPLVAIRIKTWVANNCAKDYAHPLLLTLYKCSPADVAK